MDLGRMIRDRIRAALATDEDSGGRRERGQSNVAFSANIGTSGSSTAVYSDDDVTIIEQDGERQVIHHDRHRHRHDDRDDDSR